MSKSLSEWEDDYDSKDEKIPLNMINYGGIPKLVEEIRKQNISDDEIIESMGQVSKYQQWQVTSKGIYKAMGKIITHDKIPSGYYSITMDNDGNFYANSRSFIYDDYIDLPIPEYKEIISDIDKFWNIKHKFDEYGFVFKRGILIYGKQGLGKSFLINGVIKDVIEQRKGVVFSLYNTRDLQMFHAFFRDQFRLIEPDRPVVVVIEDIDGLCMNESNETELINLLDGVEHSANMVYLATTNHIERLEERITNRPSRFDKRYHIKAPADDVRRTFIEKKMKPKDLKNIDLDEWVDKTDGFNLAHIKELIISVILYENTLEYALKHLNDMRQKPETEAEYSSGTKRLGFGK